MEFMSESSTDSKSFGLLDENLLQDLTLNNNSNEKFPKVKEKPPIPGGKKKTVNDELRQVQMNDFMYEQNGDQAEETIVSIRLNESDLKELENEFTFDEYEDEEPENNEQDQTLNKNTATTEMPSKNETTTNIFNKFVDKDLYQSDFLLNESADILRNSNEFSKSNFSKNNMINYDVMDEINGVNNDETKQNMTNNITETNHDITANSLAEYENSNMTINYTNELASERINQLVMQSVERFKRRYQGSPFVINSNDEFLNGSSNFMLNKDKCSDRRFSASTIKTQHSKINNMSTTTNFDDNINNATENVNQSILFTTNLELNPVEPLNEVKCDTASMSIYFKPSEKANEVLNETLTSQLQQNNVVQQSASFLFAEIAKKQEVIEADASNDSMFGYNKNLAEFSICKQTGNKDFMEIHENCGEFKSGSEFFSKLNEEEMQHRKQFANNELTVLATTADESRLNATSSSSDTSVNQIKTDKWWKKDHNNSKLELSKAQDYFEINSTFPSDFASKDPESCFSISKNSKKSDLDKNLETNETNEPEKLIAAPATEMNNDETICEEKSKNLNDESEQTHHANSNDEDLTFSTSKNQLSGNASNNFSFTLNASENGDFIVKKTSEQLKATETTTPFQVTKMLNSYQQKKQIASASNLKTIGEELDRVSNRLAISNTSDMISKTTTITAITTTTTTKADVSSEKAPSGRHKNNHLILTMDETISSINSSSNRTTNLIRQQHSKQKVASGSLTSTPSKLKKGEKSMKKDDQTELTTTSNNLLSQDSFMSSIPERVNDSTLVGNHHQNQYYANNKTKKVIKNAEIQTSPDKSSSSSSSTFSSSSVDAPSKLLVRDEKIPPTTNEIASQMVTINNLAASLLSNNNNSNANETNTNRTSLFNGSNNNGLIPVAFLPVDAVFPYVQKIYDNYQQKSQIDLSSNSIMNQNGLPRQPSGLFSSLSGDYSSTALLNQMMNNNTAKQYKFELPQLELDKSQIDFGHIAEGCYDTCRLFIKLANTNLIHQNREHNIVSNLQIELDTHKNWNIEQLNSKNKSFKLDDSSLKSKLSKTLGLNLDKKKCLILKQSLKVEFVTNYYELFIHLNTADLNYFKELVYQQQSDSHNNFADDEDNPGCLEPLSIGTNLSIYYSFMDNNNLQKYLLNRIDLKYILGYARLRSTVNINLIEFELASLMITDNESANSSRSSIRNNYNNDNDKTLTSNCSKDDSAMYAKRIRNIDQIIPLSNAGNIFINVNCYFVNEDSINNNIEDDDNDEEHNRFKILNLKDNQYQLRIDKSIINLESKSITNKKQIARLTLTKMQEHSLIPSFDDLAIRLILQVKPNGFKYEIPIKFKMNIQPINSNPRLKKQTSYIDSSSSVAKIASSKSIIFFGKSLNSNVKTPEAGLINEFVIRNLNDFKVQYDLSLVTCLNETAVSCYDEIINLSTNSTTSSTYSNSNEKSISKSSINLFKFTNEMKDKSLKEDPSMTRLIIELEPQQNATIRIKFNSSLVESDKNNQLMNCFGLVKIATVGFSQRFNVFLIGFLNRSQLCVDSNENKLVKKTDLSTIDSKVSLDHFKLERQLCNKNLQVYSFEYQIFPNINNYLNDDLCFVFKKTIKVHNKSLNSRLTVYPLMYDCKENRELHLNSVTDDEICFDLGLQNDGFNSKFKLIIERNKLNYSNDITWFDLAPNEVYSLALDLELKMEKSILNSNITRKKLIEYYEKIDKKFEQFNVCLFWLESDINAQCFNGLQFTKENLKNISESESQSISDSFIKRLLSSNIRLNAQTKLRSNSFMDTSTNFPYFVNSIITKKAKLQYENIVTLMNQAMKCSILKVSILFKPIKSRCEDQNSFDFSVNTSSAKMSQYANDQTTDHRMSLSTDHRSSFLNDSTISLNESNIKSKKVIQKNDSNKDEPWSVLSDTIMIQNVKFDNHSVYSAKITIRNNLPKKELIFNVAFNSACLDVEPNRGIIHPLKTLDLTIKARKEVANKLPWHGIVSVICNKTEKDVKVSLYAPQIASKVSNKIINSSSSSSLLTKQLKPPPPIQSSTLPVSSVNNKKTIDQLKSNNSSSSYSITDSSPFLLSSSSVSSSALSGCTTLEQGTLISDISQNTLDSLSLTPLINASFQMTASKINQPRTLKSNNLSKTNDDDSVIKILHYGNQFQIQFPSVNVTKSKSYDFTLINPTNNFVSWKASTSKQQPNLSNESIKSTLGVFKLTPNSGVIQANQKQIIKIEFSPREEFGNFQELWEIDTRTSSPMSYNCKLVISGKSVTDEHDNSNILSENNSQRSFKSTSNLLKFKSRDSKENYEPSNLFKRDDSQSKVLSDYNQTIDSNKSNADVDHSSLSHSNRKIIIKTDPVILPDTYPGGKSKSFIVIDNKEEKTCNLNIISLMDPFYCNYLSIKIEPKHYIKVPIEFKPRIQGDYTEKVLIRIDSNEMPLTCILKAKCSA